MTEVKRKNQTTFGVVASDTLFELLEPIRNMPKGTIGFKAMTAHAIWFVTIVNYPVGLHYCLDMLDIKIRVLSQGSLSLEIS